MENQRNTHYTNGSMPPAVHPFEALGWRWLKSPNFSSRRGEPIDSIVLACTGQMALKPTLELMGAQDNRVSCHVIVPRNQEEGVVQLVDFKMKAWHAGRAELWKRPNVNLYSVGIQLVGNKTSGYTDWQYEVVSTVCAELINQEPGITMNRILGHDAVAEKEHGPGPLWRWDVFFDMLVRKLYGLQVERE